MIRAHITATVYCDTLEEYNKARQDLLSSGYTLEQEDIDNLCFQAGYDQRLEE